MVFTRQERRLLCLLILLLAGGYALTALRLAGLLPENGLGLSSGAPAPASQNDPWDERGATEAAGAVLDTTGRLSPFRQGQLDLNLADSLDLLALPGVGPALAGRILALRRQRGAFREIIELTDVPGIGEKRFARLAALVCAETDCRTQ